MKSAIIDGANFVKYWDKPLSALNRAPSIADGDPLIPNDRLYSALGTMHNRATFLLVEKYLNMVKGRIFNMRLQGEVFNGFIKSPEDASKFDPKLELAAETGTEDALFKHIRLVRKASSKGRMTKFL